MKKLNENQEKAITTIDGPVLIIAGPGTGKTFTLVERLVHMVGNLGINPSAIMLSTFTNKAAKELLDRLSMKFKELNITKDVNDMLLGNFHSICRRILDQYIDFLDFKKGYRIIEDVEKKYLIYRNLDKFKMIPGYYDLITSRDVNRIDKIVKLVFEEGILERSSDNPRIQTMLDIVALYEKLLISKNIIDFSGQLYYTYKLLMDHPEVRQELQAQINYIMIDEYQDTNSIQEKIVFALLNENKNICVVGDDDQGLYRFRGATVRNILHFPKKFGGNATVIKLDINYRSRKSIVDFYSSFMEGLDDIENIDMYRYRKSLKANNKDDGQAVFRLKSSNEEEFRQSIVDIVLELKRQGKIDHYNQVAVLVSSVNDSRIMKLYTALRRAGIGVYTPKTTTLISKKETSLVLGALYSVFKPLIESEKIRLSYDSYQFLGETYTEFYNYEKNDNNLEEFVAQMSKFLLNKKVNISLLDILYRFFRYEPFVTILKEIKHEKMQKNISRLMELVMSFCQIESVYYINEKNIVDFTRLFFDAFIGFIKEEKVNEFQEETVIPEKDQISLLTIHASKGMEYPVVIMASLWDRPFEKRLYGFDLELNQHLKSFGKADFEPASYTEKLDFYKKYYTGFSRPENLLLLAGMNDQSNKSLISGEIRPLFNDLPDITPIDISGLEKSVYEDNMAKDIYSYTGDIAQYNFCPRSYKFFRKYRFTKTLNVGMTYGNLVHETLEFINKDVIEGNKPSLDRVNQELRAIAYNKYIAGASFITEDMLARAFAEIEKYYNYMDRFEQIKGSEVSISLAKEDFLLTGNVDMVYQENGKLAIIDFKTGRNPRETGNQELLDQYLGQLSLYAQLYQESKGEKVEKLSLYFTSLDNMQEMITVDVDERALKLFMDHASKTIEEIESDDEFEMTSDTSKCKSCDLRFFCNRV